MSATIVTVDLRQHVSDLEQQRNECHLRAQRAEAELLAVRQQLEETRQLLIAQALGGVIFVATRGRKS